MSWVFFSLLLLELHAQEIQISRGEKCIVDRSWVLEIKRNFEI